MAGKRAGSRILAEMHEAAQGLYRVGAIDALTMRELDALCLPPVRSYSAREIRGIRRATKASQAVFAAALNVGTAAVSAWERGTKKPSGPALKLLELVERKGLEALV
jgi:putative transcriptional regulator